MKILISEQEKNEILNKHKNFKKILENELSKLNRGLVIEQNNNEKESDVLDSAKTVGCLTNGKLGEKSVRPAWIKIVKGLLPGKFDVGDEIVQYGDFTYEVYSKSNPSTPKGKFKWKCPELDASSTTTPTPANNANVETKPSESKYQTDRKSTDAAAEKFLNDFRPNVEGCVKMIEKFYETWENDVTNMDEQLFNQLKKETQTCANYFNGKWRGMAFRGPIRKKIEDLQGGIGGTESSSKWRLIKPRDYDSKK
jgi:DNA polymerase III gamma/tau subunit